MLGTQSVLSKRLLNEYIMCQLENRHCLLAGQELCDILEGHSFEHPKFLQSPIIFISFLNAFTSFFSLCAPAPLYSFPPPTLLKLPPLQLLFPSPHTAPDSSLPFFKYDAFLIQK